MAKDPDQPRRQAKRMADVRSKRSYIKKAINREPLPPEGEAFVAALGGLETFDPWAILEGTVEGTPGQVIEAYVTTWKVYEFLKAIPGIGEVTAYECMLEFKLPPMIRFLGITTDMRRELSALVQETISG